MEQVDMSSPSCRAMLTQDPTDILQFVETGRAPEMEQVQNMATIAAGVECLPSAPTASIDHSAYNEAVGPEANIKVLAT